MNWNIFNSSFSFWLFEKKNRPPIPYGGKGKLGWEERFDPRPLLIIFNTFFLNAKNCHVFCFRSTFQVVTREG